MNAPVSVIIPTFNRRELLSRAIESVAAQSVRPAELIVIDDGSTDHTIHFLETQTERLKLLGVQIRVLSQENLGPSHARNRGLQSAQGDFISFLDSDDTWRPSYVATAIALLNYYPTAGLAFCACEGIGVDGKLAEVRDFGFAHDIKQGLLRKPFETLVRRMPFQTSCVTLRRQVVSEIGLFDPSFCVGEDWDLWFRISKRYDFAFTTDALAINYSHSGNIKKYTKEALYSDVRVTLKHISDVVDAASKKIFAARLNRLILLLLEQTMREGVDFREYRTALRSKYMSKSLRFYVGSLASRLPKRVGQAYAKGISWLGHLNR